jgi:ubiquinone/menaquinone biosynthesis C-methylase UbiE
MFSAPAYYNRSCPVCRSDQQYLFAQQELLGFARCGDCGFLFQKEVPSAAQLYAVPSEERNTAYQPRRSWLRFWKYRLFTRIVTWMLSRHSVINALEVGCQDSIFHEIADEDPRFDATGIDYHPGVVESARDRLLDVQRSDLESMSYRDQYFDFVFSLRPQLVHNPEAHYLEMQRVLSPWGRALIVLPSLSLVTALLDGKDSIGKVPAKQMWYYTKSTASLLLERLGFRIKYVTESFNSSTIVVLAEKQPHLEYDKIPRWVDVPTGDVRVIEPLVPFDIPSRRVA